MAQRIAEGHYLRILPPRGRGANGGYPRFPQLRYSNVKGCLPPCATGLA